MAVGSWKYGSYSMWVWEKQLWILHAENGQKESLQNWLRRETYVEDAEKTNNEAKLIEKGLRSRGLRKQIAGHYQNLLSGFSSQIFI